MRPLATIGRIRLARVGGAGVVVVAAESAARASVPTANARRAAILLGVALAACANFGRPDRNAEIPPALADLSRAGFSFDADVRFAHDPMTVCDGLTCADLVVIEDRRTIRLANGAFASPSRLRATLLEIWPRYAKPRRSDVPGLARAALLVVTDGARAGIVDPEVTSSARFYYRQLWNQTPPAARANLPAPDTLPALAR
jgi:hypothetical protein